MKVIKLANGNNEDSSKNNSSRITHTFGIIHTIGQSDVFEECIGVSSVANGTVGWYRYNDGITYEVHVSPVEYSSYKTLLEEQQNRLTTEDENLSLESPDDINPPEENSTL